METETKAMDGEMIVIAVETAALPGSQHVAVEMKALKAEK